VGQHGAPRAPFRWDRVTALAAVAAVLLGAPACDHGEERPEDSGPARAAELPVDPPSDDVAQALPLAELEGHYRSAARRALEHETTAEGVEMARHAARFARLLALRERDGTWLATSRRHLREASRRRSLAGACDSAVELARLEAGDAGDLEAAYLVAYRTARRFSGEQHTSCLAEARRITAVLDAHRPSSAELAAIDADPNAEDPTGGTEADSADSQMERWARGRGDLGSALIESIAVYGAPERGAPDPGVVRVVLRFDKVAVFRRSELPEEGELPRRVFIDLEQTTSGESVPRATTVGGAGLQRIRVGTFEPGTTRVVFDLDADARYQLFILTDPYRVVVDFDRSGPGEPVPTPEGDRRRLATIVLDPGHGGNDYGARAEGLKESILTLDIAERVEALLARRLPETRVLLTRRRDELVSLDQRVAFANAAGADVFVSLHLNAADDPVEHGGVATFVLDTTDDRQALSLAARENGTSQREVTGLQTILASLHRQEQLVGSRALAELVQRGALAGCRRTLPDLPDRGVKSAMFYVLVGARMPAILLEGSFLTQPRENRALATPQYRQALAEGVAEGLVRYGRGE